MLIENMEIEEFIKPKEIEDLLKRGKETPESEIDRILDKAEKFGGLTHIEVASLLQMDDKHLGRLFKVARHIKDEIYGNRIVMFADRKSTRLNSGHANISYA